MGWREGEKAVIENGFGFTQDDMDNIADDIPNNSTALIMIIEHLWAKDIKQQLLDSNAVMIAHGMLTRDMFMQIGAMAAAEEAERKKAKQGKAEEEEGVQEEVRHHTSGARE